MAKKGMGTGTKIAIGVGVLSVIGGVVYYLFKVKGSKQSSDSSGDFGAYGPAVIAQPQISGPVFMSVPTNAKLTRVPEK